MAHYGYDGNGNPTGYTSPGNPVSGSANTNTFDPENRMTAYGVSGSSALLSATYDSDGLRASKTSSSGTTYYLYDEQDHPVVELNSSGTATFVNTFGDNGLLSRRDVSGGVTTYYAFDPQGSAVDVMTNGNGLPAAYSAFGIPASGSGGTGGPWGFCAQWGYYTDAETGLILCTHRYYDPYTGRFVNRDPLKYGGGINLYSYCRSSPITGFDPLGYGRNYSKATCDEILASINAIIAELDSRYNDLINDRKHLYERCPSEYESHQDKYLEKQRALDRAIKAFNDKNCPGPLPDTSNAYRPVPLAPSRITLPTAYSGPDICYIPRCIFNPFPLGLPWELAL